MAWHHTCLAHENSTLPPPGQKVFFLPFKSNFGLLCKEELLRKCKEKSKFFAFPKEPILAIQEIPKGNFNNILFSPKNAVPLCTRMQAPQGWDFCLSGLLIRPQCPNQCLAH